MGTTQQWAGHEDKKLTRPVYVVVCAPTLHPIIRFTVTMTPASLHYNHIVAVSINVIAIDASHITSSIATSSVLLLSVATIAEK